MTNHRYQQINKYYTKDTTLNKKISHEQTVKILNRQEKIIQMKTELIQKLTKTINKLTENKPKTIKNNTSNKYQPIINIIKNNQKNNQNTIIKIDNTLITIKPTQTIQIQENYLIMGTINKPIKIINLNHIIWIKKQYECKINIA